MLAKNYYQLADAPAARLRCRTGSGPARHTVIPRRNRHNLLSRYEFKFERIPHDGPSGTLDERHVHVVSTNGDYRRSQPWGLSGQCAESG
jgi:hypothetical protein